MVSLEVGGGVAFVISPPNREIVFRVCVLRDVSCVRSCAWFCGAKAVWTKMSSDSSCCCCSCSGGRVRGDLWCRAVPRGEVLRGVARCRAVSRGVSAVSRGVSAVSRGVSAVSRRCRAVSMMFQ